LIFGSDALAQQFSTEPRICRSPVPTILDWRCAGRQNHIRPVVRGDLSDFEAVSEALQGITAAYFVFPVKIYPLYGPKELMQFEVADILTQVLGRKITYVPVEIEAFSEIWKEMGYSPYIRQHISAVAQDCRDGVFSGTNDLVEKLTGQKPSERWVRHDLPKHQIRGHPKKDRISCDSGKSNGRWIELPLDRKAEISRFGVGS
jgi:hypothetical protein